MNISINIDNIVNLPEVNDRVKLKELVINLKNKSQNTKKSAIENVQSINYNKMLRNSVSFGP